MEYAQAGKGTVTARYTGLWSENVFRRRAKYFLENETEKGKACSWEERGGERGERGLYIYI
ncbi:hypothetical protein I7I53_01022 [Histoplasma capsulatum var. duboisii H88]|uniref:Uncharacterized protein n=1 Tax=Ajellomyces capsulatus (strain H88) TaxID=544711 RepID=A0A8A1LP43_AJEC8|nr:hypothetical protein I7I53_01022 [Histoplasma capsulatum var. duboisii H88]